MKTLNTYIDYTNIEAIYIGNYKTNINLPFTFGNYKMKLNCFTTSLHAIDYLRKNNSTRIVFFDLDIASCEPLEILQYIRQNFDPKLIFIFISHTGENSDFIKKSFENKVDEIFLTPFDIDVIRQRLTNLLEKSNNTDDYNQSNKTRGEKTQILKRSFDIIVSLTAILILSPVLLIVALLIKLDSKGPVFFISKRVGQGYKVFDFYKFRSMKTGSEKQIDQLKNKNQYAETKTKLSECPECKKNAHPCSTLLYLDGKEICENFYKIQKNNNEASFLKFKDDPRVTALGQFLRRSSIDELPQLLNILKGDMSFVGNRPLPLYEAEQLTTDKWSLRFNAPAGLTGLWQVSKRGKSDMSEEERKELDNTYARTHTFLGDIKLIFRTFPALTQKENV